MDKRFLEQYPAILEDGTLLSQLQSIQLVVFDVDGVLTDGGLLYGEQGESIKRFNVKDGVAMKLLPKWGVQVAVITAKDSAPLHKRMTDLKVEHFYPGCHNKAQAFEQICQDLKLDPQQAVYVGDDVIDLQVMPNVAVPMCPKDAHTLVKRYAKVCLASLGGQGVAREVADLLLSTRMPLEQAYELAQRPEFEK
ncbi:KdsC family phosphatase [Marinomonas sp.]